MQYAVRLPAGRGEPVGEYYGQVIVDECHHVGAVSFDAILKRIKAKYVLGLTATLIRRDGQQPIIFMQCGPIRYTAATPTDRPHDLEVLPRSRFTRIDLPIDAGIQDVFRHLANDQARTESIASEVADAVGQGRKVLVLTDRTHGAPQCDQSRPRWTGVGTFRTARSNAQEATGRTGRRSRCTAPRRSTCPFIHR